MSPVLQTRDIAVSYGGVHAVRGVSLHADAGELVGLIGPNGAGKTTFVDAISGFVRAAGRVEVAGRDLSHLTPERRARAGLTRTWQAGELFDDLTVLDNLSVAARAVGRASADGARLNGRRVGRSVVDAVEALGIGELVHRMPAELTTGQRRLVGVARAMAAQPAVLCLDEPAAGLDSEESEELGRSLRGLCELGAALLLVDHDMQLVLSTCDRVIVMDFGEIIASCTPDQLRRDERVVRAYLGDLLSSSTPDGMPV